MADDTPRRDLLPQLRECKILDTKRKRQGLTVAEHDRWLQLKDLLGSKLAPGARERRGSHRVPTRINTSYETPEAFQEATIANLSETGVFVSTAFPLEIGSKLTLNMHIESSGERLEIPCVVVSRNVGSDFSTQVLGMGLRFTEMSRETREAVTRLYREALAKQD
jgi:uncharacterized protein (TIGR02266 family)